MKNLGLQIFVLLFSLFVQTNLQAKLTEQATSWERESQSDRIYLKSDHLVLSDEGIFIVTESNTQIPISKLFCDSQGLYTTSESLSPESSIVYPIVWCDTCKAWRTVNIQGKCVVCGNIP